MDCINILQISGSATTNVEALLAKRHSVGIDISPFSRFIAKVKVTPLDEVELESLKVKYCDL